MRRDFSETAEQSLKDLIDQIDVKPWEKWTDGIADFFILGLDIQNYLDDVDTYHKKILDKKDTDKDKLAEIFRDVRAVDAAYQSIFQTCCDHVKEQREYIEQLAACIDTQGLSFNVMSIVHRMSSVSAELTNSKVSFYLERLKNSEGNGEYDYEYLREIMNTDPNKIPVELYAALICTFNEMDLTDKEKFIESAYILQTDSYPDKYPVSRDYVKHKNHYKVSDVLIALSEVYVQLIDDKILKYNVSENQNDDELEKKLKKESKKVFEKFIGNYSLLRAVCEQGSDVYVTGYHFIRDVIYDLDLTLKNHKSKSHTIYENDYRLEFYGSPTPYDEWDRMNPNSLTIDVYGIHSGLGIDFTFDEQARQLAESFRVDIEQNQSEEIINGIEGFITSGIQSAVISNVFTGALAVSTTILMEMAKIENEYLIIQKEGEITNSTIDQLQTLLIDGNNYTALHISASYSFSDGKYQMYYIEINKEDLDWSLLAYMNDKGMKLDFSAEDVALKLKSGNNGELAGLDNYIEWYIIEDGEKKTNQYKEDYQNSQKLQREEV